MLWRCTKSEEGGNDPLRHLAERSDGGKEGRERKAGWGETEGPRPFGRRNIVGRVCIVGSLPLSGTPHCAAQDDILTKLSQFLPVGLFCLRTLQRGKPVACR